MSGQMPKGLAAAAGAIALRAEADAKGVSIGRLVAARTRATLEARKGREADSLPGRTWREMPIKVRTVVVMLACAADGDPRHLAAQPWASFAGSDQCAMSACARDLARGLSNAASLF